MDKCKVARLYWESIDAWLSEYEVSMTFDSEGFYKLSIDNTSFEGNKDKAAILYLTPDDYRAGRTDKEVLRILMGEGLSVEYDEVPLKVLVYDMENGETNEEQAY